MNQEHITLKVGGMTCMGCVNSVKKFLGQLPGVSQVDVDLVSGLANIDYNPALVDPSVMRQSIINGGFQVES